MTKVDLHFIYSALFYDIGDVLFPELTDVIERQNAVFNLVEQVPTQKLDLRSVLEGGATTRSWLTMIEEADTLVAQMNVSGDGSEQAWKASDTPNLEDVFTYFKDRRPTRYSQPTIIHHDRTPHLDKTVSLKDGVSETTEIVTALKQALMTIPMTESHLPSWLNTFESLLSFVPSKSQGDISFYEHAKLRVAFATCFYRYAESLDSVDFLNDNENACLLVTFDFSGIQDFIYNIVSKGALKQLKARSLYLDMMSEYLVDRFLLSEELSRFNLIYNGGGHAYILLPNSSGVAQRIKAFEEEYNSYLLSYFKTRLYVVFASAAFAPKQLVGANASSAYKALHRQLSRQLSEKKIKRYNAKTLISLNETHQDAEQECLICHTTDRIRRDDGLCQICSKLGTFAKQIGHTQFAISPDESGLPIGPNAYLTASAEGATPSLVELTYIKNNVDITKANGVHIFIGDYAYDRIDSYARHSVVNGLGIKRMAVVRLDVDDLGAAFMAGFSSQEKGKFNTLSRSASFSRQMSRFFKLYINHFAKGFKVTIVYAGGDDVFAIGSWQDIIAFTLSLRQAFVTWTEGKLTLSAGIGLYPDKTPVSLMAKETGDLEEAAKANDKDSLCLFGDKYVFKFDQFIEAIYDSKWQVIKTFFDEQDERGKVFAYRLLELLRDYNKMNVARLAYYLSSLEAVTKREHRKAFEHFKTQFFDWYVKDEQSRLEAEVALMIYIYHIRKD
ncbi:type III-A CRISPR-associated protein Cas10/Csm1 [Streptococcus fryi]